MSIFKSPEGKERMLQWHSRFRDRMGRPAESKQLQTSFGATHALQCGPADAPPVVILHGALASSAHAMGEVVELADRYRLIGLDVIGQSPMSAEVRPEINGNTYGQWVVECLDALGLEAVNLIGVSWGGFVSCRAAAVAPERIRKLSLIVPAGIVNGAVLPQLFKFAYPMTMYRLFPNRARLERLLKMVFTTPDDHWADYLGEAFLNFRMDFRPPRLLRDGELAGLAAPVQLIPAELDMMPMDKMIARAEKVFPNLARVDVLHGYRHAPATDVESRRRLVKMIVDFLGDVYEEEKYVNS